MMKILTSSCKSHFGNQINEQVLTSLNMLYNFERRVTPGELDEWIFKFLLKWKFLREFKDFDY